MFLRLPLAVLCTAVLLTACGSATDAGPGVPVVATTTQLGDFVRAVGGPDVAVTQLLRPSSDPHDYEPRPRDVQDTADAKVVFTSGDGLDTWMADVVDQSGSQAARVDVGRFATLRLPGGMSGAEASATDPHWWHDPRNAVAAVEGIRAALTAADPDHADGYRARARDYTARIRALDSRIEECMAAIPSIQRKLVTDHDAFGYFARRYAITVVGAVIPSQSTQAQPSAGATAELVRTIRAEGVRAIFPESSVNPRLARAIAAQTGASADHVLYGDTLGPRGSRGATYLGMEQANADAMAAGFTGGTTRCSR